MSRLRNGQLYAVNEQEDALAELDCPRTAATSETRLVRCPMKLCRPRALSSFYLKKSRRSFRKLKQPSLPRKFAFRHHGLEFARATLGVRSGLVPHRCEIVFASGAEETVLSDLTRTRFCRRVTRSRKSVTPKGPRPSSLSHCTRSGGWKGWPWTMSAPWTNTSIRLPVRQMPAFSAADRAIVDVPRRHPRGPSFGSRIERDNIHCPARSDWSSRGLAPRPGRISTLRLLSQSRTRVERALAALVHRLCTSIRHGYVLRYLSPEIEWTLLGIHEHWRQASA